ncbi:invasion associated locus B family protein [Bartonella bacilliformis]|uniref:invasion associated locus B family protein n=1 Tax=Bartonella bacilliformis TaxID=774 RepID=UPI0039E6E441
MFALVLFLLNKGESFADEQSNLYTVHPPQLSVPSGKPGETRRIIMQFSDWTLICDESQTVKRGVCNVTQAIHDQEGHTIFSWSLVLTTSGQAVMLLRMLPSADISVPIRVSVEGFSEPIVIRYTQCDAKVCLAQSPLGLILRQQIEQRGKVRISYQVKSGQIFSFVAPFEGLSEALSFLTIQGDNKNDMERKQKR